MFIQDKETVTNSLGGSNIVVGVFLGLPDKLLKYSLKSTPYGTASCNPSDGSFALSMSLELESSPTRLLTERKSTKLLRRLGSDSFSGPLLPFNLFTRLERPSSESDLLLSFRWTRGASSLQVCNRIFQQNVQKTWASTKTYHNSFRLVTLCSLLRPLFANNSLVGVLNSLEAPPDATAEIFNWY